MRVAFVLFRSILRIPVRAAGIGALLFCGAAASLHGQVSPTPVQPSPTIDPALGTRIRSEIANSGLTAQQVRARLRAAGYPESLLNQYLPDSSAIAGTANRDSLANAVVALGLADSTILAQLRGPIMRVDSTRLGNLPRIPLQDGLPIFGLDVFRGSPSQFEPDLAGGVGGDYRIGPGDVLALILTGELERAYSLDVSREGFILIPQVGQVYVANLTLAQTQDLLFSRLRQSYSNLSRSPNGAERMYVTVSRLHSNQVFVIGEVLAPGSYQISSVGTVLTALYAAGGPNDNGTLRQIRVTRGPETVGTIDLYNYLVRGDASKDVRLQSGDVVFVGIQAGRVTIRGPVVRPAAYEILPGETLTQFIQDAGGFTAEAATQRVQVRRVLPPSEREPGGRDRVVLDVLPSQFAGGAAPSFVMLPGDRVEVFGVTSPERNAIVVSGDVWSPGTQGFRPGMTLSQALRTAGGVRPDVYLGQVLVSRLESDRTRRSLHAELRDSVGTLINEIPLQEDDSIFVYSRTEFTPPTYVAIAGAIRNGGQFAYRTGMTLRELMLLAGGPLESADLREAEIARFPALRRPGILAQTFRVPLDSSYLFDLRSDGARLGAPGIALPPNRSPEVQLQPYDNVLILRQPQWQLPGVITVIGEVKYPGSYTLKTSTERITDILARAGGLTDKADPEGLVFFRRADSAGRIGVNLPSVLGDRKSRDNFVLEPGDSIQVEAHKPYVRVAGAVNSPISVAFVPGADLDYYIGAAGGPTRNADKQHAYVRQPNGSVESRRLHWLLPDGTVRPKAGATVIVPDKDPTQKTDYSGLASALTPLIATALTIATVLLRR